VSADADMTNLWGWGWGGMQLNLCASPRPLFSGNISVTDCIWLCLAYCRQNTDWPLLVMASLHTCDKDSGRCRWDTHDQSCEAWRCVHGLTFVTDDIAEMLKNATYICL